MKPSSESCRPAARQAKRLLGCSRSQRSEPCEPLISQERKFFRPVATTDDSSTPMAPLANSSTAAVPSSAVTSAVAGRRGWPGRG